MAATHRLLLQKLSPLLKHIVGRQELEVVGRIVIEKEPGKNVAEGEVAKGAVVQGEFSSTFLPGYANDIARGNTKSKDRLANKVLEL